MVRAKSLRAEAFIAVFFSPALPAHICAVPFFAIQLAAYFCLLHGGGE
jgi:hypothetical protein